MCIYIVLVLYVRSWKTDSFHLSTWYHLESEEISMRLAFPSYSIELYIHSLIYKKNNISGVCQCVCIYTINLQEKYVLKKYCNNSEFALKGSCIVQVTCVVLFTTSKLPVLYNSTIFNVCTYFLCIVRHERIHIDRRPVFLGHGRSGKFRIDPVSILRAACEQHISRTMSNGCEPHVKWSEKLRQMGLEKLVFIINVIF